MIELAKSFFRDESFQSFVYHFSTQMIRLDKAPTSELVLASGLLCHELFQGNVCVNLTKYAGESSKDKFPKNKVRCKFPEFNSWIERLKLSSAVGAPGAHLPLILEQQADACLLYSNRYWNYEDSLANEILSRVDSSNKLSADNQKFIDKLFPASKGDDIDWQKEAALAALTNSFAVITGGPGTGKTTTVVKILAALLNEQLKLNPDQKYNYKIVAPTGKAASRLKESLRSNKEKLRKKKKDSETDKKKSGEGGVIPDQIYDLIKDEASTIHRLLGYIPGSVQFRHNKERKLAIDCLILDEASMVDLSLMAKLFEALPKHAKVILLGDENQLASVEAGSVLRDICEGLTERSQEKNPVVTLEKSYRFDSEKGIGKLSKLINSGAGEDAYDLLDTSSGKIKPEDSKEDNVGKKIISWQKVPKERALSAKISKDYLKHYESLIKAKSEKEAFKIFNKFMILCALRKGSYGVERLNYLIEKELYLSQNIPKDKHWYPGKPVLITANDYQLNLFNGDIGITFYDSDSNELRIYFEKDGEYRKISPHRLPRHELAFAITVHKSQGSEFEEILLLLPAEESRILTKELIYTGITRAKEIVTLMGEKKSFIKSVKRSIERSSGLKYKFIG